MYMNIDNFMVLLSHFSHDVLNVVATYADQVNRQSIPGSDIVGSKN